MKPNPEVVMLAGEDAETLRRAMNDYENDLEWNERWELDARLQSPAASPALAELAGYPGYAQTDIIAAGGLDGAIFAAIEKWEGERESASQRERDLALQPPETRAALREQGREWRETRIRARRLACADLHRQARAMREEDAALGLGRVWNLPLDSRGSFAPPNEAERYQIMADAVFGRAQ